MTLAADTAVVVTKGPDHLDIWVDANNNGVQDDDDVNIYITASGGFYTTSPTFKNPLDTVIQAKIKELAIALLTQADIHQSSAETKLRSLALELVVKATGEPISVEDAAKADVGLIDIRGTV